MLGNHHHHRSVESDRSGTRAERNALVIDSRVYRGSRFMDVWKTLRSDPYRELPQHRLDARDLALFLKDSALLRDARRTLDTQSDLLPSFRKLVHRYGISLRGTWRITRETPYTGYFATGSEGLIIARASDALGEYRPGKLRFLGMAGKIYPTSNPQHRQLLKTANFFVFENIGGSHTQRFTEASFSNDLLPVVPHLGAMQNGLLGSVVGPLFVLADRTIDPTQAMIRQLYPIAELGETNPEQAVGPRFMKLVGTPNDEGPVTPDLREELDMTHHPYGIRFEIHVADKGLRNGMKQWVRIGEIRFSESVASESGDTRLHFAHPRYDRGRAEPT